VSEEHGRLDRPGKQSFFEREAKITVPVVDDFTAEDLSVV
jgi:hypothetical protein